MDDDIRYLVEGRIVTWDELRKETLEQVADLPPETWRDGKFDFNDYLIESLLVGTIEQVEIEDD